MIRLQVDIFTDECIVGWAMNEDVPTSRLMILLLSGGRVVAATNAQSHRSDIASSGYGDGNYAYELRGYRDAGAGIDLAEGLDLIAISPDDGLWVSRELEPRKPVEPALAGSDASLISEASLARPRIVGEYGFLSNNIRDFSASPVQDPPSDTTDVHSVRLEGFGSGHWHDDDGTASAEHFLAQLGDDQWREIAAIGAPVLLDMSNEGPPLDPLVRYVDALHDGLTKRNIRLDQCTLLLQNRRFGEQYARHCRRIGLTSRMQIGVYDYYVRRMFGLSHVESDVVANHAIQGFRDSLGRDGRRRFLSMNYTPRPVRAALVSRFVELGYLDRAYVSFRGFGNRKDGVDDRTLPAWFPDLDLCERGLVKLLELGPLTLDVDAAASAIPEFDVGAEAIYRDSHFSVVTETETSAGEVIRITEKSIKPIIGLHPFVIVGNPYSLDLLCNLGFRTFAPFIDESYDRILDPAKRLAAVLAEVDRLMAMSDDQMKALSANLADIVVHNYIMAVRYVSPGYRATIEPRLLAMIGSV